MSKIFKMQRQVQFHETDLMGVVHHANYVKFFEDARVQWMLHSGIGKYHHPSMDRYLAVLNTQVQHLMPARFLDSLEVSVQVRLQGLKIEFQYAIDDLKTGRSVAKGFTSHVMVDKDLKPKKLEKAFVQEMENWQWTETWL